MSFAVGTVVFDTGRHSELTCSTRYRDLLTSATQITALRESSLRLSTSLQTATTACASPQDIGISSGQSDKSEGEEVMSLLPVAAHMKLLLDAPEGELNTARSHSQSSALFLARPSGVSQGGLLMARCPGGQRVVVKYAGGAQLGERGNRCHKAELMPRLTRRSCRNNGRS